MTTARYLWGALAAVVLLLRLLGVVISLGSEDDVEPVQQIRVLVVKSTCDWQVIPLHRFAYLEHAEDRMSVIYGLALDVQLGLLD
jgi:hypothetical protein